jgi:hypothetical protein
MDNNPILQPVTPSTPSRLLTQVKIFCLSDYDRNYLQKYTKDFPCPDHRARSRTFFERILYVI